MKTEIIKVTGMICDGGVGVVTKILNAVNGVKACKCIAINS